MSATVAPTLWERDLDEALESSASVLADLRGAHLFVTGGTGFVGSWLVETFLWANRRLSLGARLTLLVRDERNARNLYPRERERGIVKLATGDVRSFHTDLRPDAIINAAVSKTGPDADPSEIVDTIVAGAGHVLALAARSGAIPVLFTSSGAVYGRQPPELERVDENYAGGPPLLDERYAYHEAKRFAETLHAIAARGTRCRPKIARLFAFVGPHLALDRHFAIGNFIADAMRGGPIIVSGDGKPMRSYLYGTDMASWLWHVLLRGEAGRAYNVGSRYAYSIAEVARTVASVSGLGPAAVEIREPAKPGPAERYVPDTSRARDELGVRQTVDLDEAIRRTLAFHGCEAERAR